MKIKLSDYVMQRIAETGVKHVFFLPGGGAMHLNDSLGRCSDIQAISNLHEQASAIAAEAYARITNNLGVAMVTTGPGGTNAVTGVAGAWLDSTPCLFVSGQVKRADLKGDSGVRILGVQEIDIVSVVRTITKYAVTVMDPLSIRYHMEKAVYLARSGRRGPAWIDIPLDVQAAMIDTDQLKGFDPEAESPPARPDSLPGLVRQVIEMLETAERPVLLAGNGIRMAGAQDLFLEFLASVDIPVLTTWLAMDLIPDSHRSCFGRPGSLAPRGANFALQNSDLLLIVGSRMDMAMTAYAHDRLARAATKIMVDIDEAEIRKMKTKIHLPIVADAGAFIRELIRQSPSLGRNRWPAWSARCSDWKARYPIVLPEHRHRPDGKLSTYHFSEMLSEEMTGDNVIAPGSSGLGVEIFLLVYKMKSGQRIFHNRGTGAMGFGLPASIGACLAADRKRTICVEGDGSLQLNIQELETVARLKLPIKFFIINNEGYASIRASQQGYFKRLTGADATSGLTLPDTFKIAAAYGLPAVRLSDPASARGRIREVLSMPGPVVCEVVVAPDEDRIPRAVSMQRPDGSMVSKPLEDLYPFLDRDEFRANMMVPVIEEP